MQLTITGKWRNWFFSRINHVWFVTLVLDSRFLKFYDTSQVTVEVLEVPQSVKKFT
jgi:hypothetical protein